MSKNNSALIKNTHKNSTNTATIFSVISLSAAFCCSNSISFAVLRRRLRPRLLLFSSSPSLSNNRSNRNNLKILNGRYRFVPDATIAAPLPIPNVESKINPKVGKSAKKSISANGFRKYCKLKSSVHNRNKNSNKNTPCKTISPSAILEDVNNGAKASGSCTGNTSSNCKPCFIACSSHDSKYATIPTPTVVNMIQNPLSSASFNKSLNLKLRGFECHSMNSKSSLFWNSSS
mmetsp:Transcript_8143/g.23962  ORF Transcript_8143/g.23962 Transcript_8143/m.23962 type:complete len:232 (-) Transcript_8143:598-1293(-)